MVGKEFCLAFFSSQKKHTLDREWGKKIKPQQFNGQSTLVHDIPSKIIKTLHYMIY